MKKLLLFLTIAVVSAGSIKAMDSNSLSGLDTSKKHLKYVNKLIKDFKEMSQGFDMGLKAGLVGGLAVTAGGSAIPTALVTITTISLLGSLTMDVCASATKVYRKTVKDHIQNIEHNQIQS